MKKEYDFLCIWDAKNSSLNIFVKRNLGIALEYFPAQLISKEYYVGPQYNGYLKYSLKFPIEEKNARIIRAFLELVLNLKTDKTLFSLVGYDSKSPFMVSPEFLNFLKEKSPSSADQGFFRLIRAEKAIKKVVKNYKPKPEIIVRANNRSEFSIKVGKKACSIFYENKERAGWKNIMIHDIYSDFEFIIFTVGLAAICNEIIK